MKYDFVRRGMMTRKRHRALLVVLLLGFLSIFTTSETFVPKVFATFPLKIRNMWPDKTVVKPGESVVITVTVENIGDKDYTFDIDIDAHIGAITTNIGEIESVTLTEGEKNDFTHTWTARLYLDVDPSTYHLLAFCTIVDSDDELSDWYFDDHVTVTEEEDMMVPEFPRGDSIALCISMGILILVVFRRKFSYSKVKH